MNKRLKNGMKIRICEMKNSDSITFILKLNSGSATEPKNKRGLTHLVEHMCFRGHCGKTQEEFYYAIEKIGAHLRGATYRDCILFEITVLRQYISDAVDIIRGLFEDNEWTYEDIRREKNVVLCQMQGASDWCFRQLIYDFFCKSSAGECSLGTANKVLRCTKRDLTTAKKELFTASGAELIVVGNVTEAEAARIESVFSDVPDSKDKKMIDITPKRFLNRDSRDFHYYNDDSEESVLAVAFDIEKCGQMRTSVEILRSALCGGLFSPFMLKLREELGLLDEITSGCDFYDFGGIMYLIFQTDKENAGVLETAVNELFLKHPNIIDMRTFECAKAAFTDRVLALESTSRDFANILAFNESISSIDEYISQYSAITLEEVHSVAQEIIKRQNATAYFYNYLR